MIKTSSKNIHLTLLFLIIVATIIYKWIVLIEFSSVWSDSDQAIMWNALENFSKGRFHEPRFYGQAYNSMLEALFAVPLHQIGLPVYLALPIITSLFTLFPYYLLGIMIWRKKSAYVALIILSIPLLLPIEYHMITSLSRGFVTGLFAASFCMISFIKPNEKMSFLYLSLFSIIGFSLNPNSIILTAPCILYVFLNNQKNLNFYKYFLYGVIAGAFIHFLLNSFYYFNPNYIVHDYELFFTLEFISDSFNHLDHFFNHVSPVFWNQGFLWMIILIILGVLFMIRKEPRKGLFILSIPLLIVVTFGFSKVHDGYNGIFFSYARMYLALPYLIGLALFFLPIKKQYYVYFLLPFVLFLYSISNSHASITDSIKPNKEGRVLEIAKIEDILKKCTSLKQLCFDNKVDLIVIINDFQYDFINYGCSACIEDFPNTIRPEFERRTWRLKEEKETVSKNILFLDNQNELNKQFDFIDKIDSENHIFLCKNNKLKTIEILEKMHIPVRKFE